MNTLKTTLCLSLAILMTGCGSNGGNNTPAPDDTNVAEDSASPTVDTTEPDVTPAPEGTAGSGDITPVTVASSCSNSQSFDIPANTAISATSATISRESGAEGDVLFDCKTERFSLTPGIASLNIIDIQRQDDIDFSCKNSSKVKANVKYDYINGVITYTGTLNGQTVSCSDTYISPLEAVISDDTSIRKLLLDWGDTDTDLQSSTCPDDKDGALDNFDQFSCSGTFSSNYAIMDSTGKTHQLSTKLGISFQ